MTHHIYRYHKHRAEKKAARRPPSPFAAFVKSSYPGFGAQNPGVPASAVMSNIAAAWKAVSSEEKASMASEYKTQVGFRSLHLTKGEQLSVPCGNLAYRCPQRMVGSFPYMFLLQLEAWKAKTVEPKS